MGERGDSATSHAELAHSEAQPAVSVFLVRALIEMVERRGIRGASLLLQAGLEAATVSDAMARLPLEDFERALEVAVRLSPDGAMGLQLGEHVSAMTMGLLGQIAGVAPTLREGLEVAGQFTVLAIEGVSLCARDEADTFAIRWRFPRGGALLNRTLAEFAAAGLTRLARIYTGPSTSPRLVCFEHERPKRSADYTRLLGNNVRFCQGQSSIHFDRGVADQRQINQHPELYALLQREADRRVERLCAAPPTEERLRTYLLSVAPARLPDVASAARELGMSERSLRRHLAAEGTSYRAVVRSAIEASARRLLRDPSRSVKEVAAALGFADAGAFVRAFRRWTGTTPGAFRSAAPRTP